MANASVENMPDFEHVNINDINPDFDAVKTGFYDLEIAKVVESSFVGGPTIKNGPNAGNPNPKAGKTQKILKLHIVIVNDEEFSGRRVFESLFEGSKRDYQFVARIAKATSSPQQPGETLFDYLSRLAEAGAQFKGKVLETPDDPYNDNALDRFSVQAV